VGGSVADPGLMFDLVCPARETRIDMSGSLEIQWFQASAAQRSAGPAGRSR